LVSLKKNKIMTKNLISFDDVCLVPGYSEICSRHDIDLAPKKVNDLELGTPIIASCMDTVVSAKVADIMRLSGSSAVLHRYMTIESQVSEYLKVKDKTGIFCAIGATGDFYSRFEALYNSGCRLFCVDVAHGYHVSVRNAIKELKKANESIIVMAGNVADLDGFNFLADAGADLIRVGVAGGAVCETRNKTGFGLPTLESVLRCSRSDRNAMLVADGGFRDSGDIVKALACGADFVMLGSMLSGHKESPGEVIEKDNILYKKFRGMASESAQKDWRGFVSVSEGKEILVPLKEKSLEETVDTILKGVKSGLSYAGCNSLKDFTKKVSVELL
jgi:IMP dehydrogenase